MSVTGELLTRWTIRLALAMAAGAVIRMWWTERRGWRGARLLWTVGCSLGLAHAAVAMVVYHGGSHWAAVEATRRETYEVLGIDWGGGLYFNYAFLLVWSAEVACWWLRARRLAGLTRPLRQIWHFSFASMVFFGAVVFEQSPIRWLNLAAFVVTAAMALNMRIRVERPH